MTNKRLEVSLLPNISTFLYTVYAISCQIFKGAKTLKAIMWTEELDEVFRQNYQADPALSWQYFGSDTGILRHYPASQWQEHDNSDNADTYDCRKRSWYIETATCSKDIVILLDNSGSMAGFRRHVGKFTIRSILDTFSNNDFFTVFNYSAKVSDLIPCFKGALVQATPENKNVFNDAISKMEPTGYANLSLAYEKAFQLLKKVIGDNWQSHIKRKQIKCSFFLLSIIYKDVVMKHLLAIKPLCWSRMVWRAIPQKFSKSITGAMEKMVL